MEAELLQVLNPQSLRALEEWQRRECVALTQVNGQRRYGGPPPVSLRGNTHLETLSDTMFPSRMCHGGEDWRGPVPGPGCEVFINQIPRDVFEDRLIPLFQSIAPLYEFRLMMNFSGQNRGFAYAKYGDPATAVAAVHALNKYPLQEGVRLVVRRSTEKRQLCLGDLPSGMGREELLMVLRLLSDGVEDITMKAVGSRGEETCALVHYSSHYAASMAKKVLVQDFKKQFGVSISIRWITDSSKFRQQEHLEEISLAPPGLKLPAKLSVPPPRFQITRPSRLRNYRDPLPPLPAAPPSPSPPPTQGFSRAVGGPAHHVENRMVPFVTRRPDLRSHDSVGQLRWLCELHNLGVPLYDVRYHHTSPDGFLHFNYRIIIPRLPVPLSGAVQILPGISTNIMEDEVRRAVAEQAIKVMCHQR